MGAEQAHGAHGLRIVGLARGTGRLQAVPAGYPILEVVRAPPSSGPVEALAGHVRLEAGRAEIGIAGRGTIALEEAGGRATFRIDPAATDEEVLHPYLSIVAAVRARWRGRQAFHAGALAVGGVAWGVVGARGSGKSTLLATCAARGVEVLTDDLLVLEPGGNAFAGPRFVDLRRAAAERLGVGEALGRVGARRRWRVPLAPTDPELPFGGWIVLRWGAGPVGIEAVPPRARIAILARSLAVAAPPSDPTALLQIASLPMLTLRRPRDWDSVDRSCALLLARLDAG